MNLPKVREQKLWIGTHESIPFRITNWNYEGSLSLEEFPNGAWCYYIYLNERLLKERFKEVWLKDKVIKYHETSPERITHDYSHLDIFDFHGGITYYKKHGHTVGHRSVELGCDYQHLFDRERGCTHLNMVLSECTHSCEVAKNYFTAKENQLLKE